jgi:uncharacterized protein (DUF58 family)
MASMREPWRGRMRAFVRPRRPEALPAEFDRRRIYVLPTRFGLFFGVLLLVMLAGALNYNNNPALLLGLLLAGAGLASLVAAQLQVAGLRITAVDAPPVPAGTPLQVRVHAQAPGTRVRRGLRVEDESAPDRAAVLNLDEGDGQAQLAFDTRRRGWFDLPRLRISTTRPLGLARVWAFVWPEEPLLVYPAPEANGPPLPEGAGELAQTRLHPSGDDVHHLRPYRAGDARRAIAWKHSARRDTLLVREYEQPLGTEVVLDWQRAGPLPVESRIARLARWIDEAERDGRRYRLVLPGHPDFGPDHGTEHRHACLRALALMPDG